MFCTQRGSRWARDDVGLKIPALSYREKVAGEFNDDALWEEADPAKFVYFGDFCRDVHERLFRTMVNVLGLIECKAIERFGRVIEPLSPTRFEFKSGGSNYQLDIPDTSRSDASKI